MIKQSKATTYSDQEITDHNFYVSIKYDGNYIQAHCDGKGNTRFFSSLGNEFKCENIAEVLKDIDYPVILEGEFLGESNGKLGDRRFAATLRTLVANFKNDRDNEPVNYNVKFFDIIMEDTEFKYRRKRLEELKFSPLYKAKHRYCKTFEDAYNTAQNFILLGYEGGIVKYENHLYIPGKRLLTSLKVKRNYTADLLCVDVSEGKGKYTGQIGSLILQDKDGNKVNVGSGLNDDDRTFSPDYYKGKIIEIKYESFQNTYVQPRFVCVR